MINKKIFGLAILALLVHCALFAGKQKGTTYVYFSLNGESKLKVYKLDYQTKELVFLHQTETDGNPFPIKISKDRHTLYLGTMYGDTGKLSSYIIDQQNGSLTHINTVDAIARPTHISLSPNEKVLLSCYFNAHRVGTHLIDSDKSIKSGAVENQVVTKWPHMIKTNATGNMVFVPNMGGNNFHQYGLDQNTGKLNPLIPSTIDVSPDHMGPRHFVYHPMLKDVLYATAEINFKVMGIKYDLTGLSIPFESKYLLPDGYTPAAKGDKSSDIHITPDGRFLYVATRLTNQPNGVITGYSVDLDSGELTLLGYFDTEPVVREFEIDSSGKFLIAAGENSGKAILYEIKEDGSLQKLKSYFVGDKPFWVESALIK